MRGALTAVSLIRRSKVARLKMTTGLKKEIKICRVSGSCSKMTAMSETEAIVSLKTGTERTSLNVNLTEEDGA